MTAIMPENSVSNETKADSVGSMLVNIFLSPMRVFESIKAKPTWIIPFMILLLATAVAGYFTAPMEMEMKKQEILSSEDLSPEQRDQTAQQMEAFKGIGSVLGVVGGFIAAAVMVFLMAAVVMFMGTVILGGSAKYMQLVALLSFTGMVGVLGLIVKTPLMVSKQTVDIRTSLAVLLPGSDVTSISYTILNGFTDVFFIWQIILLIFGVAVIYNFTKAKAAIAVLIPVGVAMLITGVMKAVV